MSRRRIDPAAAGIVRTLKSAAGPLVIEQADSAPWSSNTLVGARHRIALRCRDAAAAIALAHGLAERDFAIPGHLVADIGAVAAEGDVLRFEALVLEDG